MSQPKVLIVEDEAIIALEIESRLATMGYAVSGIESSGTLALRRIEVERPDIVLMDINILGPRDGIETAIDIRQRFDIPVVFLTAFADAQTLGRARGAEPYGYLTKPIRGDDLRATIEMAVYKHQLDIDMRQKAIVDTVSGLYNRRFLDEALAREFHRSSRAGSPLTAAMIDIDFFKSLNDSLGHDAGDQVIRTVAELLRATVRRGDLVCRYGGDEFTILFPDTLAEGASRKLEVLRRQVESASVHYGEAVIRVTISAGVATAPDQARNAQELLFVADKALLRAKESGRNAVFVAGALSTVNANAQVVAKTRSGIGPSTT